MATKTKTTLKEQMAQGQIMAPLVYDAMCVAIAANSGFKAFVLSTSGLAMSWGGVPDIGILSTEDVFDATARLVPYTPYPVIVEFDNGFGETPYIVWHNVRRLAGLGAAAVIIDDTTSKHGKARMLDDALNAGAADCKEALTQLKCDVVAEEAFYAKIRAALAACEGTDCMVVAATNAKYSHGLNEAVKRLQKCREIGADITMCRGLNNAKDTKTVGGKVEGPKMYYEYASTDGKPDVDLDAIAKQGFDIISVRYMEKAALYGCMDYGVHCVEDRQLEYVDNHTMGGRLNIPNETHHKRLHHMKNQAELLKKIQDLSALDKK